MKTSILRQTIAAAAGLLVACSPPPKHQEKSDGLESLGEREGVVFDIKLDTIAYMSCEPKTLGDSSSYFTFRAGAYRNGGIALKEDFVERMEEINRKAGDLPEIIQRSPVLAGAHPVLSVRKAKELQTTKAGTVSPFFVAFDDQNLLSKTIPAPGTYVQALPREDKGPIRFEGSVNVANVNQETLRSDLSDGDYFLTVTLGDATQHDFGYARAPKDADDSKVVYGVRFDLGFSNSDRYLVSTNEFNLESNQEKRDKKWVCPESLRFQIHKQHHATGCPVTVDPVNYTGYQASVRQVLRAEDWSIHWNQLVDSKGNPYRCIVPKRGTPANCYFDPEKDNIAHFVSFCVLE